MHTTRTTVPAPFIGVDPTDRHACAPRAMDVCGLQPIDSGAFEATFWQWRWPQRGEPLDVSPLLDEIAGARCTLIDGPQGLARAGARMRECERVLGAAGKSPDVMPQTGPFAGFVRSSVELFAALHAAKVPISPAGKLHGVFEVYPGRAWQELAKARLPRKTTSAGRVARAGLLAALGVRFRDGDSLTHDRLDACIAAVVGAALTGGVDGLEVRRRGLELSVDRRGVLREGPILHLAVTGEALRSALDAAFGPVDERAVVYGNE